MDEAFSKDLYAELSLRMDGDEDPADDENAGLSAFTDDLYDHLSKRPEYSTSELYKGIKSRVAVDDPLVVPLLLAPPPLLLPAGSRELGRPQRACAVLPSSAKQHIEVKAWHGSSASSRSVRSIGIACTNCLLIKFSKNIA